MTRYEKYLGSQIDHGLLLCRKHSYCPVLIEFYAQFAKRFWSRNADDLRGYPDSEELEIVRVQLTLSRLRRISYAVGTVPGYLIEMLKHLRVWYSGHGIPHSEIDAAARRLIVEYGAEAAKVARSHVQRAQWAKGKSDAQERVERILRAIQAIVR